MPMLVATVKVAALAVALTCIGAGRPAPDANPRRLQCRMYFGCMPIAAPNTAIARQQQQEYVR